MDHPSALDGHDAGSSLLVPGPRVQHPCQLSRGGRIATNDGANAPSAIRANDGEEPATVARRHGLMAQAADELWGSVVPPGPRSQDDSRLSGGGDRPYRRATVHRMTDPPWAPPAPSTSPKEGADPQEILQQCRRGFSGHVARWVADGLGGNAPVTRRCRDPGRPDALLARSGRRIGRSPPVRAQVLRVPHHRPSSTRVLPW